MTKPNELTPEQAIERVEKGADPGHSSDSCLCVSCNNQIAEALRIVLELAKRPYALGEGEREALAWMRDDLYKVVDEIPTPKVPKVVRLAALTAALSLPSPFTREELEILRDAAAWYPSEAEGCRSHESGLERYYPVAAKLDAMLAQSAIEE